MTAESPASAHLQTMVLLAQLVGTMAGGSALVDIYPRSRHFSKKLGPLHAHVLLVMLWPKRELCDAVPGANLADLVPSELAV